MSARIRTPFEFTHKGEVRGEGQGKGRAKEKRGRGECWDEYVGRARERKVITYKHERKRIVSVRIRVCR